jgi:hypothetical protein
MDRDSHEMEGSNACGCTLDKSFTNVFSRFAGLQSLNLFACKNLTSQGLVQIADHCPNLEELNIDEVGRMPDHCPPNPEELNIDEVGRLPDQCPPNLEELNIDEVGRLPDHCPPNLEELNIDEVGRLPDYCPPTWRSATSTR